MKHAVLWLLEFSTHHIPPFLRPVCAVSTAFPPPAHLRRPCAEDLQRDHNGQHSSNTAVQPFPAFAVAVMQMGRFVAHCSSMKTVDAVRSYNPPWLPPCQPEDRAVWVGSRSLQSAASSYLLKHRPDKKPDMHIIKMNVESVPICARECGRACSTLPRHGSCKGDIISHSSSSSLLSQSSSVASPSARSTLLRSPSFAAGLDACEDCAGL